MRFDDGTTDHEPHPKSLRLRREECLEQLDRIPGRQSHTGVADRNQYLTTVSRLRLDRELAARLFHGLDAIEHQIHEYLL